VRRLREAFARWRRPAANAPAPARTATTAPPPIATTAAYPGDFIGMPDLRWTPHPDGRPDPGEVVWTWVPFEEDHLHGKDRPVLLVGTEGPWLLAVPLTSKDHDRDAAEERREGRLWCDVGSGAWDSRGRPSEARVDRILRVDPAAIRREGAVLDRAVFDQVAAAIRAAR
jgi:hypothetical protein